jgi:hypothetical protein
MSFNGNEGQMVDLMDAAKWTKAYRMSSGYDGVNAIFYGKNKLSTLLDQEGCVGIRIYKGIDDDGVPVMVLVGTDANENDILDNYVLERGSPCPNNCGSGGTSNPLQ